MRRNAKKWALALTLAVATTGAMAWLCPQNAHADPISLLIGIGSAIGIGGAGATAAAGLAATSFGIGVAIGNALILSAVGAAVSAGASLLGKKKGPDSSSLAARGSGINDNTMGTVQDVPVVYGRSKVGGIRVPITTRVSGNGENSYLYMIYILCEGPIDAIEEILIDNEPVTASKFDGLVRYWTRLGTDNQTAVSQLIPLTRNVLTEQWTFNGLAYIAFEFKRDLTPGSFKKLEAFKGFPTVTAVVRGKKLYDPRSGQTVYSNNPVLAVRDYLTNARYGRALDASLIDDDAGIDEANYCDAQITDNGQTMKRFVCDGVLLTGQKIKDNVEELVTGFNATLVRSNGLYKPLIFKPSASVLTLDKSNILAGVNIGFKGKKDRFNAIEAEYINGSNSWQTDLAIYQNADYLAADGGEKLVFKGQYPFIVGKSQAHRVAQIALKSSRLSKTVQLNCQLVAMQLEIGDVITVNYPEIGFTNALYRVMGWKFTPAATIGLSLEEYDADVYALGDTDLADLGDTDSGFDNPLDIGPPTFGEVTQEFITTGAGEVINQIRLEWTPPENSFIDQYELEYRIKPASGSDPLWTYAGRTPYPYIELNDLAVATYEFRARCINTLGIGSDYAVTTVELLSQTTRPPDVTGFSAYFANGLVNLSWDRLAEVYSGGKFRIRHSKNVTGAAWNDPTSIDLLVDGKQQAVTLGAIEGTYMIKARNIAGVESQTVASYSLDLPDSDEWVTIQTVTESPSFSGTKTNLNVSAGEMRLDGDTIWDDATGNWDDATGNLDDASGYKTSGEYAFAGDVDLGAVFLCRLKGVWDGDYEILGSNWDDASGLWDSATGNLDDTLSDSSAKVELLFRSTNDDPSGTPVWSAWKPFVIADVSARAFEFKAAVTTTATSDNVAIDALSVAVLMKRRAITGTVTSHATLAQTVSYSRAFQATPTVTALIKNAASGDYLTLASETRSSFDVRVYNAGGTQVSKTVNWVAVGNGEEMP